ncbi:MAG: TIGR00730 family Rossman fold protein, partial [Chlorobiales bacterium]|nr:TIGR00730 family Rossman fold protein [Chlorobiales bacterium]
MKQGNGKPQNGAGLRDLTDFMHDGWRVFKIMAEFVTGFETMAEVGPAATIFGSARVTHHDKFYKLGEEMA